MDIKELEKALAEQIGMLKPVPFEPTDVALTCSLSLYCTQTVAPCQ